MSNPFEGLFKPGQGPARNEWAAKLLELLVEAIVKDTNGEVNARLDPGFTTGAGQEWKVVIEPRSKGFPKTIIRAHIGAQDQPVRLEFGDGRTAMATTEEEMQIHIRSYMMSQQTQNLINTFIKLNDPRYLAGLMDQPQPKAGGI